MTIDLNLSAEQAQIAGSLRALLSGNHPVSRLHAGAAAGHQDRTALKDLAGFGVFGLSLPEDAGGVGLSVAEEVLLHVELGRFLVGPGALAAAIGVRVAHRGLPTGEVGAIASGASRVCLANAQRAFPLDAADGLPIYLWDWEDCDFAVLWNDAGAMLLDARRLQIARRESTDRTVGIGEAIVSPDAIVAVVPASVAPLSRVAHLLVAAQLLGMAEATRDMAVAYAKIRKQFGEPIGAFQAIKHRCADMAINAEVLGAQLAFAAIAERDAWEDAAFQNAACRQLAARYTLENAAANIQVHGGMGFSAESDAHLYLARAHLLQNIGGSAQMAERDFLVCPLPAFDGTRRATG